MAMQECEVLEWTKNKFKGTALEWYTLVRENGRPSRLGECFSDSCTFIGVSVLLWSKDPNLQEYILISKVCHFARTRRQFKPTSGHQLILASLQPWD